MILGRPTTESSQGHQSRGGARGRGAEEGEDDAGSGVQVRSAAISGAAAEDSGVLNQGMGGITDVRAMLREQKRLYRKKHLREEEAKLRMAEKKAVAVAAFTNPLDDAQGIDKEVE